MKSKFSILAFLAIYAILSSQADCEQPEALQAAQPTNNPQTAKKPAKVSEPEVKQGQAEITFDKTVNDYGDILGQSRNTCEFKFKNTGTGELKIREVKKTCGCTPFELSKMNYLPGESGTIKVKYSASTKPGPALKHIYVISNAKNKNRVELSIKANIILKVKTEPLSLILKLDEENANCQPITLKSIDGTPFKIISFSSTNETITAKFDPNAAATEFILHPKVDIEKLSKKLDGHINIKLTHPECKSAYITYRTPPQFQTNPATIIIQNADPTESISRQILVKSNYGRDFEIESVSSEKGSLRLVNQKKLKEGIQLEIHIDPPPQAKKVRFFTDWLYIQINGGERLKVHANMWFSKTKETQ
jgi:hypothetical protein